MAKYHLDFFRRHPNLLLGIPSAKMPKTVTVTSMVEMGLYPDTSTCYPDYSSQVADLHLVANMFRIGGVDPNVWMPSIGSAMFMQ